MVSREIDTYREGWQAFLMNVSLDSNPYPAGSNEAYDWTLGWENSEELWAILANRRLL